MYAVHILSLTSPIMLVSCALFSELLGRRLIVEFAEARSLKLYDWYNICPLYVFGVVLSKFMLREFWSFDFSNINGGGVKI